MVSQSYLCPWQPFPPTHTLITVILPTSSACSTSALLNPKQKYRLFSMESKFLYKEQRTLQIDKSAPCISTHLNRGYPSNIFCWPHLTDSQTKVEGIFNLLLSIQLKLCNCNCIASIRGINICILEQTVTLQIDTSAPCISTGSTHARLPSGGGLGQIRTRT